MLTDEEKKEIESEIKNEVEVAMASKEPNKSGKFAWMESKVALLIIGAILTGVLVPTFQFTQETFKWTRQNQYENIRSRIDAARSARKELAIAHSFVAETFMRYDAALAIRPSPSSTTRFQTQIVEMHNRRFIQNASFISSISFFPSNERRTVQVAFEAYLSTVETLVNLLNNREKDIISELAKDTEDINAYSSQVINIAVDINESYEAVSKLINAYLDKLEVQSERYM